MDKFKIGHPNGCGREKTCVELAPPIFCFLPENYGWNSHFSWTWKTGYLMFWKPSLVNWFRNPSGHWRRQVEKFTSILHGPKSNFPPYVRPQRRRTNQPVVLNKSHSWSKWTVKRVPRPMRILVWERKVNHLQLGEGTSRGERSG